MNKTIISSLKESISTVHHHPVIWILVAILIGFNQFSSSKKFALDATGGLTGDMIYETMLRVLNLGTDWKVLLLAIGGSVAASFVTIFQAASMMDVFCGRKLPLLTGLRKTLSITTLLFSVLYCALFGIYGVFGLACVWLIVKLVGVGGFVGAAMIILIVAVTYPLIYMLLSVSATGLLVSRSNTERREIVSAAFVRSNLWTLSRFYWLRIGIEIGLIGIVALLGSFFGLSLMISSLLIVLAVSLPIAWIRTSGLILKLDIFGETTAFRREFSNYFEGKFV